MVTATFWTCPGSTTEDRNKCEQQSVIQIGMRCYQEMIFVRKLNRKLYDAVVHWPETIDACYPRHVGDFTILTPKNTCEKQREREHRNTCVPRQCSAGFWHVTACSVGKELPTVSIFRLEITKLWRICSQFSPEKTLIFFAWRRERTLWFNGQMGLFRSNIEPQIDLWTGPSLGRGERGSRPGPRASTLRYMTHFVHSNTISAQE
jgi:hypothetical protein